jgi:hypothetical protein
MEQSNVGVVTASLGFALYVLACISFVPLNSFLDLYIFGWHWAYAVFTFERVSCSDVLATAGLTNG